MKISIFFQLTFNFCAVFFSFLFFRPSRRRCAPTLFQREIYRFRTSCEFRMADNGRNVSNNPRWPILPEELCLEKHTSASLYRRTKKKNKRSWFRFCFISSRGKWYKIRNSHARACDRKVCAEKCAGVRGVSEEKQFRRSHGWQTHECRIYITIAVFARFFHVPWKRRTHLSPAVQPTKRGGGFYFRVSITGFLSRVGLFYFLTSTKTNSLQRVIADAYRKCRLQRDFGKQFFVERLKRGGR